MKLRDNFDSEIMAWQLIDDKSFWMLVSILNELKAYRAKTCDYCGGGLWDGFGEMHKSCTA